MGAPQGYVTLTINIFSIAALYRPQRPGSPVFHGPPNQVKLVVTPKAAVAAANGCGVSPPFTNEITNGGTFDKSVLSPTINVPPISSNASADQSETYPAIELGVGVVLNCPIGDKSVDPPAIPAASPFGLRALAVP